MEIGIIVICLIIFFTVAEFFGRKKHIGRWWTFGLLVSNLLFGVIALIVSPSVKENPTSGGKNYKIWGWVCIIFGLLNLIKINPFAVRSEEHTSELQSRPHLVCRLLLEKKKK